MKEQSSHWYSKSGEAVYTVPRSKGDGMRATTLADARKLDLLPSVTTICKTLAAPALVNWLINNAAMAVATTPRKEGEELDAFIERCLDVDAQSEADAAKQLGTDIHDEIEYYLVNNGVKRPDLIPFVSPVIEKVKSLGRVVATEKIVVGDRYAGKMDCIVENDGCFHVLDFKSTKAKKLPKESYLEHRMQLSAYSKALGITGDKMIVTANVYISTVNAGEISFCANMDWQEDYNIFQKVTDIWYWQNQFKAAP